MKIYQNLKSYNSFIQYFYRQNQSFEYIVLHCIWIRYLIKVIVMFGKNIY